MGLLPAKSRRNHRHLARRHRHLWRFDCRGAGCVLVHEEKRDPFFIDARYTGALCSVGAVHWPMGELYQPGGPWGSSDPHLFGEPLPAKVYY